MKRTKYPEKRTKYPDVIEYLDSIDYLDAIEYLIEKSYELINKRLDLIPSRFAPPSDYPALRPMTDREKYLVEALEGVKYYLHKIQLCNSNKERDMLQHLVDIGLLKDKDIHPFTK